MVRFNWTDLDPATDFDDGSPNQGLIWGSLWAQNRAWRIEQQIWLLGTETGNFTSSQYVNMHNGGSGRVQEKVWIPRGTEEVSVMFFAKGGITSFIRVRCTLWYDNSNEWPLFWALDDGQRGLERTEMESDFLGPFDIGTNTDMYNHASYEGPGLSTDVLGLDKDFDPDSIVSVGTIASFLPAEFEIRFDSLRSSGSATMNLYASSLICQQKGAYYQPTRAETLFETT